MEQPWYNTTTFLRGCGCNSMNTSDLPVIYTSSSRQIEIHFTALNMTTLDDPDNLNFEATYEFIKGPSACKELRKVSGGSGTILVSADDVSNKCICHASPKTNENIYHYYFRANVAFILGSSNHRQVNISMSV